MNSNFHHISNATPTTPKQMAYELLQGLPIDKSKEFIESANLQSVFKRLVYIDGWSKSSALIAIKQYRNFLYLKKKYGADYTLPPSKEIDAVWHAHILHTKEYFDFCMKLFGFYLHHTPHLLGEAKSYTELKELFEETQELYNIEFNTYIYAIKKTSVKDKLLLIIRFFQPWKLNTKEMIL